MVLCSEVAPLPNFRLVNTSRWAWPVDGRGPLRQTPLSPTDPTLAAYRHAYRTATATTTPR